ncbi:lytic transglycosylase domain-containing protein [Rhodobacter sp. HX-7-19]|uniref:Lytic transglycosylase domain-containing protein n=1 Tax=Paragemmobacter kunshanensis TaxID=2583234 RepID=A0A6M1U5K7_9RHOB|nr:lytic transglycosylase domain-containing protein [Rhodobacter kunshanensis]NGQ93024.1 lytic transglycosylase domain-containing protein [Rhodobacter kunshanensis]
MRHSHIAVLVCALSSFSQGPAIAHAEPVPAQIAEHPHGASIAEAAERFGIPAPWIVEVMRAESANDPGAVSHAGAMGLMQVMPGTWAALRARHGLGDDPHDPRDNILAGTAYLREMWDRYGNVAAMLAAYNAGPGRYDDYLETGRTLPAETRAYVAALAPLLGSGSSSEAQMVAQTLPPDWRDAALFVARSDQQFASGMPRSAPEPGAPADGIFVTLGSGSHGP